jgi:hypothetical protein
VSTVAGAVLVQGSSDGLGTAAQFYFPAGAAFDAAGTFALIVDGNNFLVRRMNMSSGVVSTLAGHWERGAFQDGVGSAAGFNYPWGVALNAAGTIALVADHYNQLVRKIVVSSSSVTTLAGVALQSGHTNGVGSAATFSYPYDVAMSAAGDVAVVVRGGGRRGAESGQASGRDSPVG